MSEYIDKGAPWSERLDEALQSAHIGVLCLTKENLREPWINFEAGALYMALVANLGWRQSSQDSEAEAIVGEAVKSGNKDLWPYPLIRFFLMP
jgi:hypothetical protein